MLPRRDLVRAALAQLEIECQEAAVAPAHYRAVRKLDHDAEKGRPGNYLAALCQELGVPPARMQEAIGALTELADREHSGEILWSEPAPYAVQTINALGRAGIAVVVVTNSDGHAAENLRDAGICQLTAGRGAVVAGVIDSGLVGASKPDPAMFRAASDKAGVEPDAVVHIGDMMSTDVLGARSAGIVPIHLDPYRHCRLADHRHVRSLSGIWRHVAPHGAPRDPRVNGG